MGNQANPSPYYFTWVVLPVTMDWAALLCSFLYRGNTATWQDKILSDLVWHCTFDLALHRTTDNSLCEWICFAYVTGVEPIHVMVCMTKAHCKHVSHVGNDSLRSIETTNTCIGCICDHTTNQSTFISLTGCMSVQRQFCHRPLPPPSDVTGEWGGKPNSQF